jgi:hypothetical protein
MQNLNDEKVVILGAINLKLIAICKERKKVNNKLRVLRM